MPAFFIQREDEGKDEALGPHYRKMTVTTQSRARFKPQPVNVPPHLDPQEVEDDKGPKKMGAKQTKGDAEVPLDRTPLWAFRFRHTHTGHLSIGW